MLWLGSSLSDDFQPVPLCKAAGGWTTKGNPMVSPVLLDSEAQWTMIKEGLFASSGESSPGQRPEILAIKEG